MFGMVNEIVGYEAATQIDMKNAVIIHPNRRTNET